MPAVPAETLSADTGSRGCVVTGGPRRTEDAPVAGGPNVQRMTPPVAAQAPRPAVRKTGSAEPPPVPPAVQRSTAGRRLVVLPPVRREAVPTPAQISENAEVFTSSRPVGLQRMFGPSSDRFERITTAGADSDHGSPETATHDTPFRTAPSGGPSYDTTTNTITFTPPNLQRETTESASEPVDSGPPSTEPPVTPAPPAVTPTQGATAPPAPDIDELVNRLYDPLAARLRAELWLDRERAGVLMDLGR